MNLLIFSCICFWDRKASYQLSLPWPLWTHLTPSFWLQMILAKFYLWTQFHQAFETTNFHFLELRILHSHLCLNQASSLAFASFFSFFSLIRPIISYFPLIFQFFIFQARLFPPQIFSIIFQIESRHRVFVVSTHQVVQK